LHRLLLLHHESKEMPITSLMEVKTERIFFKCYLHGYYLQKL
jgi:hypothetical protein